VHATSIATAAINSPLATVRARSAILVRARIVFPFPVKKQELASGYYSFFEGVLQEIKFTRFGWPNLSNGWPGTP
jgi:hypothetical protein